MLDACELAPSNIRGIAPYQPGKPVSDLAREMGLEEATIVKLASNENPLGTSALAQGAISTQLADLARYPDGNGFDLKQALCAYYRVRPEQVVRLGITHWVAAANMETDSAEDAAIAHRLVQARRLVSSTFAASVRGGASPLGSRRFVYTPEERLLAQRGQLTALKLPKTLALFAGKLGARYLGTPAYDPHFRVFAMPLAVDVHGNSEITCV